MVFRRFAVQPMVNKVRTRFAEATALKLGLTLLLATGGMLAEPQRAVAEPEAPVEFTATAEAVDDTGLEEEVEEVEEEIVEAPPAADTPPDPGELATNDDALELPDEEDLPKGIEVIVVQAQRRSEDIQTVPESVTSFSANDLLEQGLESFTDLQFSVPNLFAGSGGLTQITSRGVGSEIVGPGIDPGFAVHVNNVFSSRESTGLVDFFDIERVDVLRGPQGTLWGRNSTGGAVNIVTKRPEHDFDVSGDAEYGSFKHGGDATRLIGMLNMPLVQDELALRIAFLTLFDDGATRSVADTNDQRLNGAGATSMRASLRWEPTNDITVDLIGSYGRSSNPGRAPKFDGDYFTPGVFIAAGAGPGIDYDGAVANPDSPYRVALDERQETNSTLYSLTLITKWQAENFQLESISGFQSTDFKLHRDADGSSLPISTLDLKDKSRQLSQEFLVHSTWARRFNYTLGTNYQYDWTPETDVFVPNAQNTADSAPLRLFNRIPFPGLEVTFIDGCDPLTNDGCPPSKPAGPVRDDFLDAHTEVKNHVFGAYGNFSYEVIDDLTLTAGGRFSYTYRDWNEESTFQSFVRVGGPFGLQVLQVGSPKKKSWKSGTWKASVDYRLFEDHNLSATVSTGSRAGGFNFIDENSFGSEQILAVEGRIKSVFFDRRLMINITGFWYDWDDPQIRGTEDNIPFTTNAPSAEAYGVELEWRALPIAGLALNGSFGWLEANYDKDFVTIDSANPDLITTDPTARATVVNINGNRLPRSPRFSISAGAQYEFLLDDYGSLTPRVDFYYRGTVSFRQYNDPEDEQSSYTRTDARITWKSETQQYWVQLFVRNLEDESVKTNQELLAGIYRQHYYDPPRSGGFRVGYNFY